MGKESGGSLYLERMKKEKKKKPNRIIFCVNINGFEKCQKVVYLRGLKT